MSDYPAYGETSSPLVLRTVQEGDGSRYRRRYFNFHIGELGGVYDSLTDSRRATLTRGQVAELTHELIAWLAST